MTRLIIQSGDQQGLSFEIRGPKFTIGRDLSNDIQLLYSKVSRVHAEITFHEGHYQLHDCDSRNGTVVNGLQIDTCTLADGDEISIGETVFVFQDASVDLTRPDSHVFGEGSPGGETVINSVPSWNVDLLKKNLVSGTELELQHTKKYLIELYELNRALGGITKPSALLKHAGDLIRDIIGADRMFAALRNEEYQDGWEFIIGDDVDQAVSLSTIPLSRSTFDQALEARSSIVIHRNPQADGAASMVDYDICSAICVPIAHDGIEGEIIGMLYGDRLGGGEDFTRNELEFATAAAVVIADALRELEHVAALTDETERLRSEMRSQYNIIGESPAIANVLSFAERAGRASSVVLIMGESGTGKELVARAIHYVSSRADEVFNTINCAAISESLLESELFGHVKGAFTGAESDKPGIFEESHKGTLFLDEIGEMSPTGQAKLLRVLEQGEISRVGSTKTYVVDVRVIAATNKDLEAEVRAGNFREDLYHRLNILTVTVPPLRERPTDIPVLLDFYSRHFGQECGRVIDFDKEALKLLEHYGWPGNIRELRNVVERMVIMADATTVTAIDLPAAIQFAGRDSNDLSLDNTVREHILKVLEIAEGNKKKAAEILGIDRSTLYSRLNSYDKGADDDS